MATCLLILAPPNDARNAVHVVPILAPIIIATDASKVIIPLDTAANVIIHKAPLEDIMAENTAPKTPNPHKGNHLY